MRDSHDPVKCLCAVPPRTLELKVLLQDVQEARHLGEEKDLVPGRLEGGEHRVQQLELAALPNQSGGGPHPPAFFSAPEIPLPPPSITLSQERGRYENQLTQLDQPSDIF